MAWQAASLISAGAGKSGIPCARFTALYLAASIDMPRITLSVNRVAFCERRGCCIAIWFRVAAPGHPLPARGAHRAGFGVIVAHGANRLQRQVPPRRGQSALLPPGCAIVT